MGTRWSSATSIESTRAGRIDFDRRGITIAVVMAMVTACTGAEIDHTTTSEPTSTGEVPTTSMATTTSSTAGVQAGSELTLGQAAELAVATCGILREWVNTAVDHLNQASSAAVDAGSPVAVREVFLEALSDVEDVLERWSGTIDATLPGESDSVLALRADLRSRGLAALAVLLDLQERVSAWPDSDTESRNARTQELFIGFEAVLAEMRPDVGPYRGDPLGDALLAEEACELTIRR